MNCIYLNNGPLAEFFSLSEAQIIFEPYEADSNCSPAHE